jgi:hypothetical protein
MSNILTAQLTLLGTRPLLWHSFGMDAIPLTKQERTGVAGNDPEEWRKSVLATPDGRLYLPDSYVFGSLRDGAIYTRKGRGTLQSALIATLIVLTDRAPLADRLLPDPISTDPSQPIYLDIRSVKNPATKGRNVRYRVAASPGWRVRVTVQWDRTVLSRGELEAIAHDAGRLVGIGSGRKIGLGRFSVASFTITDGD